MHKVTMKPIRKEKPVLYSKRDIGGQGNQSQLETDDTNAQEDSSKLHYGEVITPVKIAETGQ